MLKTGKMRGIAISYGIGMGKAVLFNQADFFIPKVKISETQNEVNKFLNALDKLKAETIKAYEELPKNTEQSDILNAYELILEDKMIEDEVKANIEVKHLNAEYAVKEALEKIEGYFDSMDDDYMKQRVSDIRDIKLRLLRELLGIKVRDLSHLEKGTVLVCSELRISDIVKFDVRNISGVVCASGSYNAHSAIILRSMEIPSVFQVSNIFENIQDGDIVTINAINGEVIVNPSEGEKIECEKAKRHYIEKKHKLIIYKNKKGITKDGKKIDILANVSSKMEIDKAIESNADGIGLFRSEFLYLDRRCKPNEDEQFNAYKYAVEKMLNKKLVIRTFDVGGDKNVSYLNMPRETSPFWGYRGIRVSLKERDLFKTQIRAILRAGSGGTIDIMLPMVSSYDELMTAKELIFEVENELKSNGIPCADKVRIGIMVETPAAAIIADMLARECDFFSIGTNDLIQYMAAIDRNNYRVSDLFSPYHPSVIRVLNDTVNAAKANNIDCSICGEVAADPLFLPILLGIGIDKLSMNSSDIFKIKKRISSISVGDAEQLAKDSLKLKNSKEIKEKLMEFHTI